MPPATAETRLLRRFRNEFLDNRRTLNKHANGFIAHELDVFFFHAELDETTALRGALAGLAGGRLARTDVRFFTECTTSTHSSTSSFFLKGKFGGYYTEIGQKNQ
jgi:hypothetical protein